MPPPSTVAQIRFTNIIACLNTASATLDVVSKSFETPFLQPISNTIQSLLASVQVNSGIEFLISSHPFSQDGQKEQGRMYTNARANS
jgi:hypothetical protein